MTSGGSRALLCVSASERMFPAEVSLQLLLRQCLVGILPLASRAADGDIVVTFIEPAPFTHFATTGSTILCERNR